MSNFNKKAMFTKVYALRFYDDKKSKLIILPIEVSESVTLERILETVVISSHRLNFKPLYGTIREVSVVGGKKQLDFPSCINTGKIQVFIIKRFGDVITEKGSNIRLNGEKLGVSLKSFYNSFNVIETN